MATGMQPFVLLLAFVSLANGQMDCSKAPSASLRTVCEKINHWDEEARKPADIVTIQAVGAMIPGAEERAETERAAARARADARVKEEFFRPGPCLTFACLCKNQYGKFNERTKECERKGLPPLRKALRKEYRTLSDEERDRFHSAMKNMTERFQFQVYAAAHSQYSENAGAHAGPAFLYWDSAMDSYLPTPADSIIWTDAFMGNPQGSVTSGPFANWSTYDNRPTIMRKVGAEGAVFNETNIVDFLAFTDINQVLAPTSPRAGCPHIPTFSAIEYTHGNVHLFVGGDMHETNTSAYDPIFYLHHSFVDLLWEAWRLKHQSRAARETEYPVDNELCSTKFHSATADVDSFWPWRNVDFLTNNYTDQLYEYAPRPSCPSCSDSKYLFCLRSKFKCASKVRPGGNCQGLDPSDQPCYNSTCVKGRCVSAGVNELTAQKQPPASQRTSADDRQNELCFNFHQCCSSWSAAGECNRNPDYMRYWCKASCDCDNRHARCDELAMTGECNRSFQWMSENCRKACGRCGQTRGQSCAAIQAPAIKAKALTRTVESCYSPSCFNENMCCQYWSLRGACRTHPDWMNCNCRVACGKCRPSYEYGGCRDHHSSCPYWASMGQCDQNDWMLENCRASCRSCYNNWELSQLCSAYGGRRPRSAGFGFLAAIGAGRTH